MSKLVAVPGAIKAIREAKAGYVAANRSYTGDPAFAPQQFAVTCLISPAHLCNIEAGRKPASEELIHRIAAHLRVPVSAISYAMPEEAAS
ncbi:MAG TPA: helix-turn-helix transcriptional regulator [Aeromicrobium sp.]|nr:helix-turn-helix transcriptional regulator [Aeromicrobium sp.]HKY57634.1 helix-turn-helix transcriptional regulator [Aeromicrobium sp.]